MCPFSSFFSLLRAFAWVKIYGITQNSVNLWAVHWSVGSYAQSPQAIAIPKLVHLFVHELPYWEKGGLHLGSVVLTYDEAQVSSAKSETGHSDWKALHNRHLHSTDFGQVSFEN